MMNLKEYYALLGGHDWTYSYSDDHRCWQAGEAARRELAIIAKQSPQHQHLFNAWEEYRLRGGPLPFSGPNIEAITMS